MIYLYNVVSVLLVDEDLAWPLSMLQVVHARARSFSFCFFSGGGGGGGGGGRNMLL